MCAAKINMIPQLQKHLQETLDFLTPYLPMANDHMVTYLTANLWEKHIPPEIREEIRTESDICKAIEMYWTHLEANECWTGNTDFEHFRGFLLNAKHFYLDRFTDVWITPDELNRMLNCNNSENTLIKGFMNEKKNYEVKYFEFCWNFSC